MSSVLQNVHICVKRGGAAGLSDAVSAKSEIDVSKLREGEVVVRVDKFGFSANNVTYGMLGEHQHFKYFDFFPAPKTSNVSPKTHAVIPVWGYATVVASAHPTVKVGRHLYGYVGMSRYVVLQLDPQTSKYSVNVALDGMPADRRPYRQLTFTDTDALYRADREDEMMLYQPLFWTSYWMEDNLHETGYRGLQNILISSASSKTAFIVAYRIHLRRKSSKGAFNPKIVGLTSASNVEFTRKLGFYDEVYSYDQVAQVKSAGAAKQWLYIDVSGNQSLNANIAKSVVPKLTVSLGMTSVEGGDANNIAKGDTSEWESFFMPEWLAVRLKQVGAKGLKEMQKVAWAQLMADCRSWVQIDTYRGERDVLAAYLKTVKGGVAPDRGQMFTLWDSVDVSAKL